jgi:NitT/TauT family transport system ATP-binding protein
MSDRKTPLLEVRDISMSFTRGSNVVEAVRDLNLDVHEQEFVSIVGPSGCGKSTLLHLIGGFIDFTGGSIKVAGRHVKGPGPDRAMMFQDLALFPWCTVLENAAWALEAQGRPKAERTQIAEKCLGMVGLLPFKNHYPGELSGGMRQRLALARVLAYDPAILLMDEPFGALDAQTRELMQEELNRIWQQTLKTVLFVTHDIEEAIYLGDRVVVFSARPGQIKADIPVTLPRPRDVEIKKSAEFMSLRNTIWDMLRDEVLKARQQEELAH